MITDRDSADLIAPTRAGYDLPVIAVTHPRFAIAEDDASLAAMQEAFLRDDRQRRFMPRFLLRFLIRRFALGALVMWLITVAVFVLFFVAPNNVARTLAGRQATPKTIALIEHRLGLDQPVWKQYLDFVGNALHGNLGYDYYYQVPVTHIIGQALPITVSLALGAAVIWMVVGVGNGVISAVKPRSLADRGLTVFALFFYSMPTFLLGVVLLYFLYFKLTLAGFRWFPAGGYAPFTAGPAQWALHMVLPWVTLALVLAATYTRLTRGSMLDVLGEDYIRTARSKGLRERRVIMRHGLRSALTPVVTQFGIDLGQLVGGVVVTETVFSLPGLGKTAIDAINRQDLPVIVGIVLFASAAVVVANILVDILYAVLDPRVRLH
jgi:peptide/nickel transport system permease protein